MHSSAPMNSRKLLKSLRDLMALDLDARERLNKIAATIALGVAAEVCSIYLKRPGDMLELFATVGLDTAAVGRTRLRIGEGLVGKIAATATPVVLANAWTDPDFVFCPETREEIYKSFLGIPILQGGRVVGVLTVQNKSERQYDEEDVETLETVAILLAYLVVSQDFVLPLEQITADGNGLIPLRLSGIRINSGLGLGKAHLYNAAPKITRMLSDNAEGELQRLSEAVHNMHRGIDGLIASLQNLPAPSSEHLDVLETYRLFAGDKNWLARIQDAIKTGLSAEAAVQMVHNETRAKMLKINDPYLRARLSDLEDIASRLLKYLIGHSGMPMPHLMDQDFIVVARDLGPAALLEFDRKYLKGLILEEGSQTAHVAIVARALDIPVVGKVPEALLKIEPGDIVIADGDEAEVYIRPGEDTLQSFREGVAARQKRKARFAAARHLPSVTSDGVPVSLMINAGLMIDMDQLDAVNADGVGLFRTEVPFLAMGRYPGIKEQTDFYAKVLNMAGNRPVTFRTLDIGGDKPLPNMPQTREENPALGWRGLRLALDTPSLLRQQLRALLRAGAGRRINIMFPMVAEVAEFDTAKALLEKELERIKLRGEEEPSAVKVGAMVEVPALLFQLKQLLKRVDFLSVGSNDLMQFLFASDRAGARTAARYDPLSAPVLTLLRQLVDSCDAAKVPLTLCGELASRPLEAMTLVGLGFNRLSMAASQIGPVKATIRQVDILQLTPYVMSLLESSDRSLRSKIMAFAKDHGIIIEE